MTVAPVWKRDGRWLALAAGLMLGVSSAEIALAQSKPACQPTSTAEIQQLLNDVGGLIAVVDYQGALSALATLEARTPCAEGVVSRDQLTQMFVYKGLTLFYLGNQEGSTLEYSKALGVNPSYTWNPSFGQRPRAPFDAARAAQSASVPERLKGPALKDGATAYLDGEPLREGESLEVMPGTHLVQVKLESGGWYGNLFPVIAGIEPTLPLPRDLLAAPSDGDRSPPGANTTTGDGPSPPREVDSGSDRYARAMQSSLTMAAAGAGAFVLGEVGYHTTRKVLYANYYRGVDAPGKKAFLTLNALSAFTVDTGIGLTTLGVVGTVVFWQLDRRDSGAVSVVPWVDGQTAGFIAHGEF